MAGPTRCWGLAAMFAGLLLPAHCVTEGGGSGGTGGAGGGESSAGDGESGTSGTSGTSGASGTSGTSGAGGGERPGGGPPERPLFENVRIRNSATSLCLAARSEGEGEVSVTATSCSNTSPQVRWDLAEVSPATAPPRYTLRLTHDPSLCLTYLPEGLSLRDCAEEPDAAARQRFQVTASDDGYQHEIADSSGSAVLTALQPGDVAMLPRGELSPTLQRWAFF